MVKQLRMLLLATLALLWSSAIGAETTVSWVAAEAGFENGDAMASSIALDSHITLQASQGSNTNNAPKYYTKGEAVRFYGGNTLGVIGGENVTISKIVLTFGSGDSTNEITTDVETYADGEWNGSSQSVVFTIEGTSGHRRIASVEVTYDVEEATPNSTTWNASNEVRQGTFFVADGDLSFKWEEGSGDQAPSFNSTKSTVSMKRGNKFTLAGGDENVTITEVVFTFDSSSDPGMSANVGTTSNSYADNTTTWSGSEKSITFTAGGARQIKSIKVTYTGKAAPVVMAPVLAITTDGVAATYDMDANRVFVVYYENSGNAAAEGAKLTLYVDGVANSEVEIGTIAIGATNQWKNMKYDLTNITAGEHQVYLSLTADNADEAKSEVKTVTFEQQEAEPTFTVSTTAATVDVEYGATSFDIVATVTNTSEVDATNVVITLWNNGAVDTKTIETLAAGASTDVTFTVTAADGGFAAGTADTYYVQAPKNQSQVEFTVNFADAPFVEVKDLAITEVSGTIDLANASSNVRIVVKNNGNVDITDAAVELKAGEKALGNATVTAKAGQSGWCTIAVASEGLEAGELAVTATVTVDGDATPADNTLEATLTVRDAAAPVATFELSANPVNAYVSDETITVVVNVKNTSEVDAENVELKLVFNNSALCENQTIASLAAGASEDVTFTFNNPFATTGEKEIQALTSDGKYGCFVKVTLNAAPVDPVVDMSLIQLGGVSEINLSQENKVIVWYKNNSNVAVETASIEFKFNGTPVETKTLTNVAVAATNYVEFVVPTTDLVAGQKANVEVNLFVNGDTNMEDNSLSREYDIVSGETEPQAEIMINPISGWEVQAGEQEVSVTVSVFNQGSADAENVKIELYHSYGDNLVAPQTVNITKEGYKMLTFKFNYTFEQGKSYDFTVFTNYADSDGSDNMRTFTISCPAPTANVAISRIADIVATTEDNVKIAATLVNNSEVAAQNVKVGVYKVENLNYQLVGIMQTIDEIEAGSEENVEFNLGQLEAGNYTYYVRVVSVNGKATTTQRDVNVKVSEPVVEVVEVAMSAIQGLSNIDLAAESNAISVWVENKGNVDADATINVTLNDNALEAQTVTVKAGRYASVEFTLPTEGLVAGQKAVVVATVTVENNVSEATAISREYDIVNSSTVAEAVFQISAAPVEIEFGTEKFDVVALVKNTSDVDAENVEVSLFHNETIATETIAALAAGEETTVTFADVENPFVAAGDYTMYVIAPKAQSEVTITVKPEPVVEVVEVAISAVQGISNIDLASESNIISVWAENKGNVDAVATFNATFNGTALEAQTISIAAGKFGFAQFTLPTEGLVAGQKATLVATVTVQDNTSEDVTLTREYDIVNSAVTTEPVFQVSAAPVEVEFGAEKFNVAAVVKNISDVDAENVEVTLWHNSAIATQTITALAAGQETTVTFADVENPFAAAGNYTMYVMAPNAQSEVSIIVKPEPVEEKIDIAVTAIQGSLSLDVETNYVTVFVENLGTVDVTDAIVTLTAGNIELGRATVSAKAGNNGFCSIAVPSTSLTAGEFTLAAKVDVENDVDTSNNELTKDYTIEAAQATLSFTAEAYLVEEVPGQFVVRVTVKNESADVDAANVVVKAYTEEGKALGEATIESIKAGATQMTEIIGTDDTLTEQSVLQVLVNGSNKWVNIVKTTGINDVKSQLNNTQIYTIDGKRTNNLQKGAYIINGKKVMVK